MEIYRRFVQSPHGRKRGSTGAKNGGPAIGHVTIDKNGHTHTRVIGWTAHGKGHAPKEGHKPITIIDQPRGWRTAKRLRNATNSRKACSTSWRLVRIPASCIASSTNRSSITIFVRMTIHFLGCVFSSKNRLR